ncbi:MAG: lytic transglycosylase domain-containing protein [Alphaproteobacteria bacterium]
MATVISAKVIASCLILAAQTYHVPAAAMIGIMHVEGGRVGQQVLNTNGSYDLGPMQVNTLWLPQLARLWRVDVPTAHNWVRDNGCVNVYVAAWILRQKIDEAAGLYGGIARYHSGTPWRGDSYARKVLAVMERKGLVVHGAAKSASVSAPAPASRPVPIRTAERTDNQNLHLRIIAEE